MCVRNVCDTAITPRASVSSIADWAHARGKKVGVVSTARITHATPGAMYAHSEDRDWEDDAASPSGCGDIARQLVQALESGTGSRGWAFRKYCFLSSPLPQLLHAQTG